MRAYCNFCHQDNVVKLNRATNKAVCTTCTRTVEIAPMMLSLLRESKDFVCYEKTETELDEIVKIANLAIEKKLVKRIGKLLQIEERIFADFEAFVDAIRKEEALEGKLRNTLNYGQTGLQG